MTTAHPRQGDRFIHASFLAAGARPPYDPDSDYQVRVITTIRYGAVYHRAEDARHADRQFPLAEMSSHVRRWLDDDTEQETGR